MTDAYYKIDRFLRNNLDDPEYEDYSAALEEVLAAAPQHTAEPVAWMDDFGNVFPLAANKGAGHWLDDHKRTWKPLYTSPQPRITAAQVEELKRLADEYARHSNVGAALSGTADEARAALHAALDALVKE